MKFQKLNLFVFLFCFSILFNASAQTTPDPGLAGTYAVSYIEYNLGDLAFTDPSFPDPMEVRGSVHYPTMLSAGPFPVLMLMHGRHETVYQTSNPSNTNSVWPPPAGYQSITSFQGYDYFAQQIASHGYIVISISTNAINANDASLADRGMAARGALMQHHLDLWNTWNTTGGVPFGTTFVGKLDMNNIGTMGHSRGGEGVVVNALLNRSLGSPYGIKAVLTLAPVDFQHEILTGVPLLNIAPYCDGDVTALSGVHFYDDSRYADLADETPKHSILVMGANHNFFNTVWTPGSYVAGTSDDWNDNYSTTDIHCGTSGSASKRLTPAEQQATFNAYASAFFRLYIGGETAFAPILKTDDRIPPASSTLDSNGVFVSWHPPASDRLDVNRTDSVVAASVNTLSGTVTEAGLLATGTGICDGGMGDPGCGISSFQSKEPHRGSTTTRGLNQMGLHWDGPTDSYTNDIPAANQNVSNYLSLQFRAAVNWKYAPAGYPNFTIQLIDGTGAVSSVQVANYTRSLFYQPGTESGILPKVLFNTIKIPLTAFSGIDLTQIQKIKFLFDQTVASAMNVSDIAFSGLNPVATGIHPTKGTALLIYPNPTENTVMINFGNNYKNIIQLSLFDIQGKLIYQTKDLRELTILDLSSVSKGLYILKIEGRNDSQNYKIVKQ